MENLRIDEARLEKCSADKAPVNLICNRTAVHYILSGSGVFNGKVLGKGQGFITLRNEKAEYYPDKDSPWEYVWFRFCGDGAEKLLSEVGILREDRCFSFDYAEELLHLCGFFFENSVFRHRSDLFDEGVLKMVLSYHEKASPSSPPSQAVLHAEEAKRFLASSLHRNVTIRECADSLFLSRSYLRNIFFSVFGTSPREYLTLLRIERAKELLSSRSAPVSVIARSVGYEDALQFSKFFKKHVGTSPKDFREKSQKDPGKE